MATGTVRLHRVLRATPERVYQAFLDAEPMVKWLPPWLHRPGPPPGSQDRRHLQHVLHPFLQRPGTEACYLGWQESLALLAQLMEAEIPG